MTFFLSTTQERLGSFLGADIALKMVEKEPILLLGVPAAEDSKVVSTHLWNTPLNLYQQAMKGFLSWLTRGFALWVCCNFPGKIHP